MDLHSCFPTHLYRVLNSFSLVWFDSVKRKSNLSDKTIYIELKEKVQTYLSVNAIVTCGCTILLCSIEPSVQLLCCSISALKFKYSIHGCTFAMWVCVCTLMTVPVFICVCTRLYAQLCMGCCMFRVHAGLWGIKRPAKLSASGTWLPRCVLLPHLANGHWSTAFLRHPPQSEHTTPDVAPSSCPQFPPSPSLLFSFTPVLLSSPPLLLPALNYS